MYTVGAVITLSLLTVARQYAQAAALSRGGIRAIGDALTGVREDAILAGVFAFILGALMYYYVLYRSRLVPRWLSGWGIAAGFPMLIACLLAAFSHTPRDLLHDPDSSHRRAGDGPGGLADIPGIQPGRCGSRGRARGRPGRGGSCGSGCPAGAAA